MQAGLEQRQVRRRRYRRLWRKAADVLGFSLSLLTMVLVLVAGWVTFASATKSGWNSDAAAWVQAAGSIAAIAGAAWIAQNEARRARRVRRQHNEEAAWHVRFAITQAQLESQIIAAELIKRPSSVEESEVRGWRQRATTSAIGFGALVSRTDHIHPAVTHVIANAKVLIDDLLSDLADLAATVREGGQANDEMLRRITAPHHALLELIDVYDARMRGVHLALDEWNDALPIRAWASWDG